MHANVRTGLTRFIGAIVLPVLLMPAQALAGKFDQTITKFNVSTVFRSAMAVGDPTHEIGVELLRAEIKYSDPAFKVTEELIYNQFDYANGSGPQRGTFLDRHADGSTTYGTYEGEQKTVANADGSWVTSWEGKYRYLGGSGKFAKIKGAGTYKGRLTSTGEYSETGKESGEY